MSALQTELRACYQQLAAAQQATVAAVAEAACEQRRAADAERQAADAQAEVERCGCMRSALPATRPVTCWPCTAGPSCSHPLAPTTSLIACISPRPLRSGCWPSRPTRWSSGCWRPKRPTCGSGFSQQRRQWWRSSAVRRRRSAAQARPPPLQLRRRHTWLRRVAGGHQSAGRSECARPAVRRRMPPVAPSARDTSATCLPRQGGGAAGAAGRRGCRACKCEGGTGSAAGVSVW